MSNFIFSCPKCRQNLTCDTSHIGSQITCPLCNQVVVVPPPAAAAAKSGASGLGKTLTVLGIIIAICAALGAGGWFGWHLYSQKKSKGSAEAEVPVPTAAAAMQALSILTKVHSAYTNLTMTSAKADSSLTLFINLTNITLADINPDAKNPPKNPNRRAPWMPRFITNSTDFSARHAQTNQYFLFSGEAISKVDGRPYTNTFAFWKTDQGQFSYMDMHQKMIPPMYQQLPDVTPTSDPAQQFQRIQRLFEDPANLAKIVKDLGQTEDSSVDGQSCYTLTAKVLGQKVKVWVDKSSYLIPQWQIVLGGKLSDADIDDAFSLFADVFTNVPPAQFEMIKPEIKKRANIAAKLRGTITCTTRNFEINPKLAASDFNYPVPPGVRLISPNSRQNPPSNTGSSRNARRNACINNLRQLDAAKQQWALEKGKKTGEAVTEADIKPFIKTDSNGNLPKCPDGGKYTIGKVGETPACSITGHVLP